MIRRTTRTVRGAIESPRSRSTASVSSPRARMRMVTEQSQERPRMQDAPVFDPSNPKCEKHVVHDYTEELLGIHQVPHYYRDNPHITTGYRHHCSPFMKTVASLFSWHNETLNVWTHLLSGIFMVAVAIDELLPYTQGPNAHAVFGLIVYVASAVVCLLNSSVYHWFMCYNGPSNYCNLCKLDFCGITFLIWGSGITFIHYAMVCHPMSQMMYSLVYTALGVGLGVSSLFPFFHAVWFRTPRALLFTAFGVSGAIVFLNLMWIYGAAPFAEPLYYLGLVAVFYLGGVTIYVLHIPERWSKSGLLDFFNSHVIWHLMVTGGAYSCYKMNYAMFEWSTNIECSLA